MIPALQRAIIPWLLTPNSTLQRGNCIGGYINPNPYPNCNSAEDNPSLTPNSNPTEGYSYHTLTLLPYCRKLNDYQTGCSFPRTALITCNFSLGNGGKIVVRQKGTKIKGLVIYCTQNTSSEQSRPVFIISSVGCDLLYVSKTWHWAYLVHTYVLQDAKLKTALKPHHCVARRQKTINTGQQCVFSFVWGRNGRLLLRI